jgi:peptidoglycan/xylan/chitin deacetylase (PgdA/CDA1 family)
MRWKRITARAISEICAAAQNGSKVRAGLRILLYHSVGSSLVHDSYGISIDRDLFARHMQILAEDDSLTITSLSKTAIDHRPLRVAVTFDDGYRDNLYAAAPILLKLHIPFTVFITTSFLQQRSRDDYLSPKELKELAALPGVSIGSHGVTHLPLTSCDDATLQHEVHDSRRKLEDWIGKRVDAIAYPFGSVNRRVRDAASDAGYVTGVTSRFDINNAHRDPLLLCRSEIIAADTERVFRQKIRGAWDWYRWRARDPAHVR